MIGIGHPRFLAQNQCGVVDKQSIQCNDIIQLRYCTEIMENDNRKEQNVQGEIRQIRDGRDQEYGMYRQEGVLAREMLPTGLTSICATLVTITIDSVATIDIGTTGPTSRSTASPTRCHSTSPAIFATTTNAVGITILSRAIAIVVKTAAIAL